ARAFHFQEEDYKDIIQSTWLSIFKLRRSCRKATRDITSYLAVVTMNVAKRFRKRGASKEAFFSDMAAECWRFIVAPSNVIHSSASRTSLLNELIKMLAPEKRLAIAYRFLDRLPHERIAATLHVSRRTVQTWIKKALAELLSGMKRDRRLASELSGL